MQRYQNIQRTIATERPEEDSGGQSCEQVPTGGSGGGGSDSEADSSQSSLGMGGGGPRLLGWHSAAVWQRVWAPALPCGMVPRSGPWEWNWGGQGGGERGLVPAERNRQEFPTRNIKEKWIHSKRTHTCASRQFVQWPNHFLLSKFICWCPKDFPLIDKTCNEISQSTSKKPHDNTGNNYLFAFRIKYNSPWGSNLE